jgi:tetratricopeptide (TPR) repeat protein
VHRDLKPDNIMVTVDGQTKILDFGLAKLLQPPVSLSDESQATTVSRSLTKEGAILGTISYMSPEQARGEAVDPRSDVFSLGVTLYELVTGETPFQRNTVLDTLTALVHDQPLAASRLNSEVPLALDRILEKCLQKDPNDRFRDCDALGAALGALRLRLGRRWRAFNRVALVVVAAIAIAFGGWWVWIREAPAGSGSSVPAVVVSPLRNLANDDSLSWYGEGVADLLRNNLAQSPHLSVVSRTLSYDASDTEFLQQLVQSDVDYLVTGEILPATNGLTVIARLTDVHSGDDLVTRQIDGLGGQGLLRASDDIATTLRLELGVPATEQVDIFAADFAAENPAAYEAYVHGLQLLLDYRFNDAEESFMAALGQEPDYTMARYRLAQIQTTTSRTEEALANIRQAMGESADLTDREARYIRAAEAYIARRYDDAIQEYEQILQRYPHEIEARILVSHFLRDTERYQDAVAHLSLLSRLDRDNQILWSLLGDVYLQMRDCQGAERAVDEYIRLSPESPNAYHQRGETFRCRGDFERAAQAYAKAFEIDSTQTYAVTSLALMEALLGRTEDAERRLEGVIDDPEVVVAGRLDAAFDLASIYRAGGRFAEAARILQEFEVEIEQEQIREAMALAVRGLSLMELGDTLEAERLIDLAIERSPTVPTRYLYARGMLELQQHRTDAVRQTADEILVVALPPEDPDRTEDKAAAFLRGMASLQDEDHEDALENLQRSIELEGYEYSDYRLGLALAMLEIDRPRDALGLAAQVETSIDVVDPRLDLQLDRTRAVLLQARIRQAMGHQGEAVSLARRFSDTWSRADPSLPDLELARQIGSAVP